MSNVFYVQNLLKEVKKEIDKGAKRQRSAAASFVAKQIRKKISDVWFKGEHSAPGEAPGMVTGNLRKGVYTYNGKGSSFAGTHAPAYHVYLLEFGTKNMKPRPFVYNTFDECTDEVERILNGKWL